MLGQFLVPLQQHPASRRKLITKLLSLSRGLEPNVHEQKEINLSSAWSRCPGTPGKWNSNLLLFLSWSPWQEGLRKEAWFSLTIQEKDVAQFGFSFYPEQRPWQWASGSLFTINCWGFFSSLSWGRSDMILQEFRLSSADFPLTAHKGWATLGMKALQSFLKISGWFQLRRPGTGGQRTFFLSCGSFMSGVPPGFPPGPLRPELTA